MSDYRFEWNPAKARENFRKYGVSFEEARSVFSDDQALMSADPDHSDGEDRFLLLGMSSTLRILTVIHCYLEGDGSIRLISARKATRTERAQYGARWMR